MQLQIFQGHFLGTTSELALVGHITLQQSGSYERCVDAQIRGPLHVGQIAPVHVSLALSRIFSLQTGQTM